MINRESSVLNISHPQTLQTLPTHVTADKMLKDSALKPYTSVDDLLWKKRYKKNLCNMYYMTRFNAMQVEASIR